MKPTHATKALIWLLRCRGFLATALRCLRRETRARNETAIHKVRHLVIEYRALINYARRAWFLETAAAAAH